MARERKPETRLTAITKTMRLLGTLSAEDRRAVLASLAALYKDENPEAGG